MINLVPSFPKASIQQLPAGFYGKSSSSESKAKLDWAHQVLNELYETRSDIQPGEAVALKVTNFTAHPQTMRIWIKKALVDHFYDFPQGIGFSFRGPRSNGTLYVTRGKKSNNPSGMEGKRGKASRV